MFFSTKLVQYRSSLFISNTVSLLYTYCIQFLQTGKKHPFQFTHSSQASCPAKEWLWASAAQIGASETCELESFFRVGGVDSNCLHPSHIAEEWPLVCIFTLWMMRPSISSVTSTSYQLSWSKLLQFCCMTLCESQTNRGPFMPLTVPTQTHTSNHSKMKAVVGRTSHHSFMVL